MKKSPIPPRQAMRVPILELTLPHLKPTIELHCHLHVKKCLFIVAEKQVAARCTDSGFRELDNHRYARRASGVLRMRVIVEVQSGAQQGRKICLRSGQEMTFGRTIWADETFADDAKMSGTHFALEADNAQCRLCDFESTNGTQLNADYVKEAILSEGDRIVAGATQFVIHLEGALESPGRPVPIVRDPVRNAAPIPCTMATLGSGLNVLLGTDQEGQEQLVRPSLVALQLGAQIPLSAIVDFARCGESPPADLRAAVPLYDWLPEDVALQNSPLIIPSGACGDLGALIDSTWGHDAIICLFSNEDKDSLTHHLQDALHFDAEGVGTSAGHERGMLGYCWPSVLAQLLAFRSADFVAKLLSGIEAVLLEVPAKEDAWQLFARPECQSTLEQLGFLPEIGH